MKKRSASKANSKVTVSRIPASQKRGGYSGSAPKVKPKPPKGSAITVPAKR